MTILAQQASLELMKMVNEWADSYIKSTDLPVKILEAAEAEGLSKEQIRKIVEEVLVKRGLSERRIREVLPTELKDQTKVHSKPAALSAAKSKQDKTKELEEQIKRQQEEMKLKQEALEEEKRQRLQLEDALRQTEQFVPATKLQDEGEKAEEEYKNETAQDPTPIVTPSGNEVYDFFKEKADGVHSFYYDAYGIDLFKNRELSQLKNSGVRVFKRLYFEV